MYYKIENKDCMTELSKNAKVPQCDKTAVSGSVFHPAISHVNCDENIPKETVNAINEMVNFVFSKQEIKESKKFITNVFKNIKNKKK